MQNLSALLTTLAFAIAAGCGGTVTQIPEDTDAAAAQGDADVGDSAVSDAGTSGDDSATTTTTTDGSTTTSGEITWTYLVSTYLASGKPGNCAHCHGQFSTPAKAYAYLSGKGYMKGSGPPLVGSQACLSWYSGNMPPGGPTSLPAAVKDFDAWAAAGAKND